MKNKAIRFVVLGAALICSLPIIFAIVFAIYSGHYDRLLDVAEKNLKGWVGLTVLALIGYGIWLLVSSILKQIRSK